jgi:hypothetical protein
MANKRVSDLRAGFYMDESNQYSGFTPISRETHELRKKDLENNATFWETFQRDTPTGALFNNRLETFDLYGQKFEEGFEVTSEMLRTSAQHIPEEYWSGLQQSKSLEEWYFRMQHFEELYEYSQKDKNWLNIIGANVLDPAYLATAYLTFGAGGAVGFSGSKAVTAGIASRTSGLLRGAVLGAASVAPVEAARTFYDPLWTADQAVLSTVGGAVFGGALGGLFPSTVFGKGWKGAPNEVIEREAMRAAGIPVSSEVGGPGRPQVARRRIPLVGSPIKKAEAMVGKPLRVPVRERPVSSPKARAGDGQRLPHGRVEPIGDHIDRAVDAGRKAAEVAYQKVKDKVHRYATKLSKGPLAGFVKEGTPVTTTARLHAHELSKSQRGYLRRLIREEEKAFREFSDGSAAARATDTTQFRAVQSRSETPPAGASAAGDDAAAPWSNWEMEDAVVTAAHQVVHEGEDMVVISVKNAGGRTRRFRITPEGFEDISNRLAGPGRALPKGADIPLLPTHATPVEGDFAGERSVAVIDAENPGWHEDMGELPPGRGDTTAASDHSYPNGYVPPERESITAEGFWSSGFMSRLRGKVSHMFTSQNPRVRAVADMLGEHSRMKNQGSIATERATMKADALATRWHAARQKFLGFRIMDHRYSARMTELGVKYRTGGVMTAGETEFFKEVRSIFREVFEDLKARGIMDESGKFSDKWLPRRHVERRYFDMLKQMGKGDVQAGQPHLIDMLVGSMHESKLSVTVRKRLSKHLLKIMTDREYRTFQWSRVSDRKTWNLIVENLRKEFSDVLDEDQLKGVADFISPRPNQNPFAHARSRMALDEGFVHTVDGVEYRVVDLFENNIESLSMHYLQRAQGYMEWREMMKRLGLPEDESVDGLLAWVRQGGQVHEIHRESIESLHRELLGYPAHTGEQTGSAVAFRFAGELAYQGMANMLGYAQLPEAGVNAAENGLKELLKVIPGFREIVNKIKRGGWAEEPLALMQTIDETGIGREALRRHDLRRSSAEAGWQSDFGSRFIRAFGHGLVDLASIAGRNPFGMTPVDRTLRLSGLQGSLDSWVRLAFSVNAEGVVKHNKSWVKATRARLDDLGLSNQQLDDILNVLRDPSIVEVRRGYLGRQHAMDMNYNLWPPDVKEMFLEAVFRNVNRIVQRNRPGNLPPLLDNPFFKVFFQFKSFNLNAVNKHLRLGWSKKDIKAAQIMLFSSFIGTLTFMAKEEADIQARLLTGEYTPSDARIHRNNAFATDVLAAEGFKRYGGAAYLTQAYDLGSQRLGRPPTFNPYGESLTNMVSPIPLRELQRYSGGVDRMLDGDWINGLTRVAPLRNLYLHDQFLDNLQNR